MKPETEARYRKATEEKYGHPFSDEEWRSMVERYEQKRRARYVVARYLELGNIIKRPCAICHASEAEAHHPDYNRALAVVWLCRRHHAKEHAALRRMSAEEKQARTEEMLAFSDRQRGITRAKEIFERANEIAEPAGEMPDEWEREQARRETFIEYDPEYQPHNHDGETNSPEKPTCCPTCKRPLP